jgi:hypothetical protein
VEKIFENEEMEIISEHSLDFILDDIIEHTLKKYNFYRKLFNVDKLDKLTFVVFDDIEKFRDNYRNFFKSEPPSYSAGYWNNIDSKSVTCLEPNNIPNKDKYPNSYHRKVAMNAHESFHFYYKKYYYGNNRIVWFDEGLAQYISGELEKFSEEAHKKKFIKFLDNYKPINNLNDRIQGNTSVPDELIFQRDGVFEGYTASYFCIKYLVDILGEDYLYKLMFNNDEILKYGETILDDMISYYKNKYKIEEDNQIKNR